MDRASKDRLERFGNVAAMMDWRMRQHVESLSDVALAQMRDDCQGVSIANCWCFTYEAAQYMLPHVLCELRSRAQKTAAA